LETLLGAAARLQKENVNAEFLVIGRGPLEKTLKEEAAKMDLKNLRFLPAVERGHVPPMLRSADAATVGFLDRPLYSHGVSPNKMFEYMENGLPIIFSCRTKGDPVSESGAGFLVEPQNPEAIAEAIKKLMKMTLAERKALGEKGREYVRERHDLRQVASQYSRLFEELHRP
jgi:glycosyltransferase involved in cell wall biosynthesis